jgi:hypothetical protein
VLDAHGVGREFIERELAAMADIEIAKAGRTGTLAAGRATSWSPGNPQTWRAAAPRGRGQDAGFPGFQISRLPGPGPRAGSGQERTAGIGRFVIFPLTGTGVGGGGLEVASAAPGKLTG